MSDQFDFSDEDFLAVVNLICKLDAPMGDYIPIVSMDEKLNMDRLDSLSMVVFFVWIAQLFGISEDKMKDFVDSQKFTVRDIKDFVTKEATQTYSRAEAEEYTKSCF